MKIMYLNANAFLGTQSKKEIWKENSECIWKVRKGIKENMIKTYAIEVAEKIFPKDTNQDVDMIFLSEIDPKSQATKDFKKKINKGYEVLLPYGNDLKKIVGYSSTVCLQKKGADYTNANNGFTYEGKEIDKDLTQICKVVNYSDGIVLIAFHDSTEFDRKWEMILSLVRLISNDKRVIVFGDTNANPDVDLDCMKNVVNSRKQRKIEAYMNNCIFEKLMNDLKLHEIKPELINGRLPKTYGDETYGTRIDRVFTNIQKEEAFISVEVDRTFKEEELSDHAALLITITSTKDESNRSC